jgi:hypothetical protein
LGIKIVLAREALPVLSQKGVYSLSKKHTRNCIKSSRTTEQVNKVAFYRIETKSVCKCVWNKTSTGLPHMLHYLNNPCWALVKDYRNMQCLAVRLNFI